MTTAFIQPAQATQSAHVLVEGVVTGPGADALRLRIATESGSLETVTAASCLLVPAEGDRVLATRLAHGEAFILAVLSRRAEADAVLRVPGAERVHLAAPALRLTAEDIAARAKRISVRGDEVSLLARTGEAVIANAKLGAQHLCVTAETLLQRAGTAIRKVRGLDSQHAGTRMDTVETSLTIKTVHGSITAQKNLRIDAEQICAG